MPQPQLNSHFFNDFKELFKKILSFLKKKKSSRHEVVERSLFLFLFFFTVRENPFFVFYTIPYPLLRLLLNNALLFLLFSL